MLRYSNVYKTVFLVSFKYREIEIIRGKVKHELRVQIYELRIQIHELRVQIYQ